MGRAHRLLKPKSCVHNFQGAHGVVASHPLRMRKALGSNPSVSIYPWKPRNSARCGRTGAFGGGGDVDFDVEAKPHGRMAQPVADWKRAGERGGEQRPTPKTVPGTNSATPSSPGSLKK